MGLISERYHRASKSILSKSFLRFIFCTEMKNKPQHKGDLRMTTDTWLTPTEVWSAKIYSDGWKKPGLGTADVTEKATGAKLGEIGIASPEDVSAAAAAAREAQKSWAKVPGPKRGDVLREFSRLLQGIPGPITDYPFDSTRTAVDLVAAGHMTRFRSVKVILSHAGGFLPYAAARFAELLHAVNPKRTVEALTSYRWPTRKTTVPPKR